MPIFQKILFVEYNTHDDDYGFMIFEADTNREWVKKDLTEAGCFNIRFSERPVFYKWE